MDDANSDSNTDFQPDKLLFIALEDQNEISNPKDSNSEGDVNLEGEFISALSELTKIRKKYARVKEQLA